MAWSTKDFTRNSMAYCMNIILYTNGSRSPENWWEWIHSWHKDKRSDWAVVLVRKWLYCKFDINTILFIGSSPSLFPIDPRLFFYDDSKNFIYLRGEVAQNQNALFMTDKGTYNPIDQMQMLNLAGAFVSSLNWCLHDVNSFHRIKHNCCKST